MEKYAVVIAGAGGVGQALLRQIVASRDVVSGRNRLHLNVVAVADSRRWLWRPQGLTDEALLAAAALKQNGKEFGEERPALSEILKSVESAGLHRVLLADVTAADGMETVLDQALAQSYGVVLANKKPLAGPWEAARRFYNNPLVRHESTVGGGQPVIAALRYLLDTNDPVFEIEGQLSGTLGYICNRLDEDAPFSVALAEAHARGYTEPDPREDLGGLDVVRKMMILGRMAGWPLEADQIEVEALYPASMAGVPVSEFMQSSAAMDPQMADRVISAREGGQVLRYVARVDEAGGSVGLRPVASSDPLADLKYIAFRTALYNEQPLLLAGRGAGVEMTAAGVLGDLIGLARERSNLFK